MSRAIYVDYGGDRFGLRQVQVCDTFADERGIITASFRTIHRPTNETINAIIQMAKTDQAEVNKLTFVEPKVFL